MCTPSVWCNSLEKANNELLKTTEQNVDMREFFVWLASKPKMGKFRFARNGIVATYDNYTQSLLKKEDFLGWFRAVEEDSVLRTVRALAERA